MKSGTLLLILLLALAFPVFAHATGQEPPPQLKLESDATGSVPNKVINDYYDSCLYHIPSRFTPQARENYCACHAAAVQGNFTMREFQDVKKTVNRKVGNPLFEKYVLATAVPCLETPVRQIEYLSCLVDTSIDIRVRHVPTYCNCVAQKMRKHAIKFADTEIMTQFGQFPQMYKEPIEALWGNPTYISARSTARRACISNPNSW